MLVDDPTETDETDDIEVTSTPTPRWPTAKRWAPMVLGILVLAIATLAVIGPVRESGYTGDDAINYLLPHYLEETDTSPYEHIRFYTEDWMENQGRFFPGAITEGTVVWHVLDSHTLYKGFQFLVVVLDLVLVAIIVRQQSRQWAPALIAVAVALSSIQFRLYHDAVLSFSAQLPLVLGAVMGTMLLLTAWQQRGWWWLLPVALGVWFFALTTYEIAFFLAPTVVLLAWLTPSERRRRLISAGVVLVPTTVLFGLVMSLRSNVEQLAPAYTTRLELSKLLPTAIYQFVGAIPANVPAFREDPSLRALLGDHKPGFFFLTLLVGTAVGIAVARTRPITGRAQLALVIVGVSLWLAPVATVAIAQRWQDELGFGIAYLGVYFESFGFALLAVAAVLAVVGAIPRIPARWREPSRIVFAVTAGLMVGSLVATTARNNQWVVNVYGKPEHTRQVALEHAIAAGLYETLPGDSTVLPGDASAWQNRMFMKANGSTTVTTVADAQTTTPVTGVRRCDFTSTVFQAPIQLDHDGFVVIARPDAVAPAPLPPPTAPIVGSSRMRVFVPGRDAAPEFEAREFGVPDAPLVRLPASAIVDAETTDGGMLVDVCLPSLVIDTSSLTYD